MAVEKNLVLDGAGLNGRALYSKLKPEGQEIINLGLKTGSHLRKDSIEPYFNVDLFCFLAPIVVSEARQFILSGGARARLPDGLVG